MAHLIDESTGQAAAFFARKPAWHGLGTVVADALSSADAIRAARLDWHVRQYPVFARLDDGRVLETDRVANVRTDTDRVLGVVSKDYVPLQNREAFAFLDSLVEDGSLCYETAGAVKEGRQIWLLARMPGSLAPAGTSDEILPYALLTNGHDGSRAITVLPTTVRVVCNNTLCLALRKGEGQLLRIRHEGDIASKIEAARQCLGLVSERLDAFQEQISALAARDLSVPEASLYFQRLFPIEGDLTDRQRDKNGDILSLLLDNFVNERNTLPGVTGTAWAAYNAVSEWADHQRTVRGPNDTQRAENRFLSVVQGPAHDLKHQAFEMALALAV
jgi:phage/plasmid-like protein (TIGR03299 family)